LHVAYHKPAVSLFHFFSGDLESYMYDHSPSGDLVAKLVPKDAALFVFGSVAVALTELEKLGVIFRGINPQTLCFDGNLHCHYHHHHQHQHYMPPTPPSKVPPVHPIALATLPRHHCHCHRNRYQYVCHHYH
jgi:hypothetical protein